MKKLMALSVGLISTSVFAQDFLDLNYFSLKNKFELNSRYSQSKVDFRNYDTVGPISSLEKVKADILSNKLTYGLTQNLRIGLVMDIALNGEMNNTKYHGPSDLKLISEYRVFTDGEYFIDANAGYQLSTEKSSDRNYRSGHDVITLGSSMGQKQNFHEWKMTGDLNYHSWGKNSGEINNPYADFDLGAKYQYLGINKFALGLGMDWKYLAEKTIKSSGGTKSVTDTDSILAFNVFAKYALTESLNLEAGYELQMRYELDSEIGSIKQTSKYREGSTLYVGAKVKF